MSKRVETFAGLPKASCYVGETKKLDAAHAWELPFLDVDTTAVATVKRFLDTPGAADVTTLVLGNWHYLGHDSPLGTLVAAADRLPNLTALRVGDGPYHLASEILLYAEEDVTPLLRAYPRLEVLRVYGAYGPSLEPLRHEALRELAFESSGLASTLVQAVTACDLPALEHLELWFGMAGNGEDTTMDDLAPILAGTRLPRLASLGLRGAEHTDTIAEALAGASVTAQLRTLDLSLGTLSDAGAEALLAGQPLTHLHKLDLHHHYLSEEMGARLRAELPDTDIDLSERQEDYGDGRYTAVGE